MFSLRRHGADAGTEGSKQTPPGDPTSSSGCSSLDFLFILRLEMQLSRVLLSVRMTVAGGGSFLKIVVKYTQQKFTMLSIFTCMVQL